MDQLKDLLRQAIKYRFWIAVGLAALFPIVAYAIGSGPVKEKAKAETEAIKAAEQDVRQYSAPNVPNDQYKPIVESKKEELVKDVNASWKKLYSRQAPLLTWPQVVDDRFRKWGRQWPASEDSSTVQLTIAEYVTAYPKFVTEVYKSFQPFDLAEGTGVVSSPPEDVLLRPFPFSLSNLPELGKVWAAQERLWTQRTILDVIAQVNQNAKDWNSATIKQINLLEVGNSAAQDQKSIAKGETLVEAPPITPAAVAAAPPPPPPGGDPNAMAPPPDAGMAPPPDAGMAPPPDAGMAPPPGGDPAGMGGGGTTTLSAQEQAESVYYIKNDSTQFKILPFELSVLIEQDQIQDLLVALENSPMAIQVIEFEMSKPHDRVTKPVKGQSMNFADYAAGMIAPMGPMGRMGVQREIFGGPGMGGGRMGAGNSGRTGVDLRNMDAQEAGGRGRSRQEAARGHDPRPVLQHRRGHGLRPGALL